MTHEQAERTYDYGTMRATRRRYNGWQLVPADAYLKKGMIIVHHSHTYPDPTQFNDVKNAPLSWMNSGHLRFTDIYGMDTIRQYGLYMPGEYDPLAEYVSRHPPFAMNTTHSEPLPLP